MAATEIVAWSTSSPIPCGLFIMRYRESDPSRLLRPSSRNPTPRQPSPEINCEGRTPPDYCREQDQGSSARAAPKSRNQQGQSTNQPHAIQTRCHNSGTSPRLVRSRQSSFQASSTPVPEEPGKQHEERTYPSRVCHAKRGDSHNCRKIENNHPDERAGDIVEFDAQVPSMNSLGLKLRVVYFQFSVKHQGQCECQCKMR